jgi:tetratricopeptide (TPR) repeat protein
VAELPRPEMPPGPRRDLIDALHTLHHEAGWPSLRVLAGAPGCSRTTVSSAFSSPRLPSWGVLELLVEAMGGDVVRFHDLWLAAGTPVAAPSAPETRIAGRKPELATVRRHLEEGSGLLVVTGEAGMGKTRLVTTAVSRAAPTMFVATGSCLPLSVDVPLLPVADALSGVPAVDDGQWLKEALSECAAYVPGSLRRLLPELEPTGLPEPEDEWSLQRLFAAVRSALTALARLRPLAVVVEDLHWADTATLDLLEHLLARPVPVPILGTWRLDDPATTEHASQWWMRVQRLRTSTALALPPLSREETTEQIVLVAGRADSELVDRIHRRSRGQPLFTEQLAAQPVGQPMPQLLADLLDQRLEGLGPPAWSIARALGVADRALDDALLTDITGLDSAQLAVGLHELENRHLLRPSTGHLVELGHPLQAEAVRRRLVTPESVAEHRRIAEALEQSADPSAAEVAEHWQRAEDRSEEIAWRIRAARSAAERFALVQAGAQWRRVLGLWPDGDDTAGSPPVRIGEAHLAAIDALVSVDVAAAWEVAVEGMRSVTDVTGADVADLYGRAADIQGWMGEAEDGLALVDRALDLHQPTAPSVGYVRALHQREMLLDALGRYAEAQVASSRALAACSDVDAPQLLRRILIERAYCDTGVGDLSGGLASLDAAARVELTTPDPMGEIHLAVARTHILMMAGQVGEDVAAAGRPGLESAMAWGLDTMPSFMLRGNMAKALRLAGDVDRAAELIDPVSIGDHPTYEDQGVQGERVSLDMVNGRCVQAVTRLDALTALPISSLANRIEFAEEGATVELWCGRPHAALDRLLAVLQDSVSTPAAAEVGADLALAARAAADVADAAVGEATRRDLSEQLDLLRDQAQVDPFARSGCFEARPAHGATWTAEMARLAGKPSTELWIEAARHWDRLGRRHDAAYSRWRGAQCALATGQATTATKLLRRAARDGRGHTPLLAAIQQVSR